MTENCQPLSDQGASAWEFVGDPSFALAQLRHEITRLRAENESLRKVPTAILKRIVEMSEIVDSDAVARTAHTLQRTAIVLSLEFAPASDEEDSSGR